MAAESEAERWEREAKEAPHGPKRVAAMKAKREAWDQLELAMAEYEEAQAKEKELVLLVSKRVSRRKVALQE